jgi:hypothetical protein
MTLYVIVLEVLYLILVLFSLISAEKPFFLGVQVMWYIFSGAYVCVYIAFEIYEYKNRSTEPQPLPLPTNYRGALMYRPANAPQQYIRIITITVILSLIFSIFSGYESFESAFSYNVKSHLFMFVPNTLLFILKLKRIFGYYSLGAVLALFYVMLAYFGVILGVYL